MAHLKDHHRFGANSDLRLETSNKPGKSNSIENE